MRLWMWIISIRDAQRRAKVARDILALDALCCPDCGLPEPCPWKQP